MIMLIVEIYIEFLRSFLKYEFTHKLYKCYTKTPLNGQISVKDDCEKY